MTQRLYEIDAYCREFKATVLSCQKLDDGYEVILDKTAFYPEGGGQAPDEGTLGGVKVLDVQEKGEMICHKTEAELPVNAEVEGKIDWDLRFSRMQSHAGEHIVAGIVHNLFGYDNVGFHMSEAVMTVDFSGPLSHEDIERVELLANLAVRNNTEITAWYPSPEELAATDYRSKLDTTEGIRLVKIEDVDCCACCAPHPSRTGDVGVIKILDSCPRKKGTRIEMVAGIHAYKDYIYLHNAVKAVMGMLSASRDSVASAVSKQAELIQTLKYENQKMSKKLAFYELDPVYINDGAYAITENQSYDDLIFCANALLEKGVQKCIFLSKTDEQNYIYVVSSTTNIQATVKALNSALNGKGGGRDTHAQGKVVAASAEEIKSVVEALL